MLRKIGIFAGDDVAQGVRGAVDDIRPLPALLRLVLQCAGIGALIISVVRIGMTFIGVDIFAQQIVFGVMLVLAVAVTIDRSKIPIVK